MRPEHLLYTDDIGHSKRVTYNEFLHDLNVCQMISFETLLDKIKNCCLVNNAQLIEEMFVEYFNMHTNVTINKRKDMFNVYVTVLDSPSLEYKSKTFRFVC